MIELVKSYGFGPNEGAVYIYKVTPQPIPGVMYLEEFYVASFSDDNTEIAWGIGSSPEEAIKNAKERWAKYTDDDNPFKKVLDQLQEGGE